MSIERLEWATETMRIVNDMTPDIKGKALDPDWFKLRERFEAMESERSNLEREVARQRRVVNRAYEMLTPLANQVIPSLLTIHEALSTLRGAL